MTTPEAPRNAASHEVVGPAARYRAICPLAITSVIFGALSIATALHWSLALIPLAGIAAGWASLRRIDRAPEEWVGRELARVGLGLACGFWVIGFLWWAFSSHEEVPPGYQYIQFEMLQPDPNRPTEWIPEAAQEMNDRRVYIKGFMKPGRQQSGIKDFILCPTDDTNPFSDLDKKRTEMIRVMMQGDLEAVYTSRRVGVAGRLRVEPNHPSGVPYGLEAAHPIR